MLKKWKMRCAVCSLIDRDQFSKNGYFSRSKSVVMNTVFLGIMGPNQMILILVVVLLLFGGRKIPELMRGLGRGVKEFKDGVADEESQDDSKE